MELVLFITVIGTFTAQFFIVRTFFRQLSERLSLLEKKIEIFDTSFKSTFVSIPTPAKNEALETTTDGIEFSEQNPINLPSDVKFEVEGGDSAIPPGFASI